MLNKQLAEFARKEQSISSAELNTLVDSYKNGDQNALHDIYKAVLSLVIGKSKEVVKQYKCPHLFNDLVSQGNIILMETLEKYSKGPSFYSYLSTRLWWRLTDTVFEMDSCLKSGKREFIDSSVIGPQDIDQYIIAAGFEYGQINTLSPCKILEKERTDNALQKAIIDTLTKTSEIIALVINEHLINGNSLVNISKHSDFTQNALTKARKRAVSSITKKLESLA